ncbi:MAG: peptide chain release factor 3, partial [Desulfobacteraceae bacterium 4572_123]
PEHFRRVRLKNAFKTKHLQKGLTQLAEEGTVQVFRPITGNDYILGAVGVLQFDVTMARLKAEYGVDAIYEPVNFSVARWIECGDRKKLAEFEKNNVANLARDSQGCLSFLTTSEFQLDYCMEEWPEVAFYKTRDIN